MLGFVLAMLYVLEDKRIGGFHLCMAGAGLLEARAEVRLVLILAPGWGWL